MRVITFFAILLFISCKPSKTPLTAQQIIDTAIEVSGFHKLQQSALSFNFRDKSYKATRNQGNYTFSRSFVKDSVEIQDMLSNKGFERKENGTLAVLSEKQTNAYSNSVNSVHYFSVLPFGLNAPAVQKKLLPSVKIKGREYYKIQVTFGKEGGGDDFDDVFLYWFDTNNFQMDYLAYKYNTNGGGMRFRDVKTASVVEGIRFVDYNNYKPLDKNTDFYTLDVLYEKKQLKKLSEINLKEIEVVLF